MKDKDKLSDKELEGLNLLLKSTEPGEDEGKDDDYNPEYMKKYLKRCMEENSEKAKEYANELGFFKKAVEETADEMDGVDEAEGYLIEGTDFVKAQKEFNDAILKSIDGIAETISKISDAISVNHDLIKASANVLVKAYDENPDAQVDDAGDEDPEVEPRKGVDSAMQKAKQDKNEGLDLGKASDMSYKEIRRMVLKACAENDDMAMQVITPLDACGGDLKRLTGKTMNSIRALADKFGSEQ